MTEYISASWTIDQRCIPFKARLQFVGRRTEVCDDLGEVEVKVLSHDLSEGDRDWLRRETERDADALRKEAVQWPADLVRFRHGSARNARIEKTEER